MPFVDGPWSNPTFFLMLAKSATSNKGDFLMAAFFNAFKFRLEDLMNIKEE